MSKTRHGTIFDKRARPTFPVTTLRYDYPPGYAVPRHFHETDQLVYASSGVMAVRTDEGTWVVPPQRAVWIPAGTPHSIRMSGAVSMRTLYFRLRYLDAAPRKCQVVNVSALLRELILHCCEFPGLTRRNPRQEHLIDALSDQLQAAPIVPLQLPNPTESRAAAVAEALAKSPGDVRSLDEICRAAGAARRTVERSFRRETGLGLGRWRQQLRLLYGVQLLAQGAQVTRAALDAGYSTPSAFIFMFRKMLGTTPSRYFRA